MKKIINQKKEFLDLKGNIFKMIKLQIITDRDEFCENLIWRVLN